MRRSGSSQTSKDPNYRKKKARVEQLYAIAGRETAPQEGDPAVVFCGDELGQLQAAEGDVIPLIREMVQLVPMVNIDCSDRP
jgi:hypothetical protein